MSTMPLDMFKSWLAGGERGLSSEAIVITLTGESWWAGRTSRTVLDHPYDPADLRRCMKLLKAVPLARVGLPAMRAVSSEWAALIDHWDELEALALEEVPDFLEGARANGGKAPRLYERMRELRETARKSPVSGSERSDL